MNPRNRSFSTGGFTLIELMILLAIIAIIMVFAIPALIHARTAANEASAITTIRSQVIGNEQYNVRYGEYAPVLIDLVNGGFISSLVGPDKSGYNFVYARVGEDYTFNGNPLVPGKTGHRYFFVDSSGVIHFSEAGPASAVDPALDP